MTSRSAIFGVLAWFLLIGGALASPFGLLILFMLIAPHSGDWPMTPFAWAAIGGPPCCIVVGIWMLRPRHAAPAVIASTPPSATNNTVRVEPSRATRLKESHVCLLIAAALLCLFAWTGYLVVNSLSEGATPMPVKSSSLQRRVERESEPVLFFFSVGLYGTISLASLGAGLWLLKHSFRAEHLNFKGPEGASPKTRRKILRP